MDRKIKENTVTLGFKELPIGLPPTKYQRVKLNGFDVTNKLLCIDGDIGDQFDQENHPTRAWLIFRDGLVIVCQRICVEKINDE